MTAPNTTQAGTAPTTAERRAIQQLKTSGGRFAVIAADHGRPLRLGGVGGMSPLTLHGIAPGNRPAHPWRAALEAGADLSAATLARSDAVGGPHRRIVATGGGVRGAAARAVKEQRFGPIEWSPLQEATARGAALLAGAAASATPATVGTGARAHA